MVMLLIVVLGFSYLLVAQLNAAGGFTAVNRAHNAKVLNQAKQALIGYVAQQAAQSGEDNPGRLPCPEAAGYYGDPAQEGIAAGSCTLPKVGRLPWRTLGLDKLVDAAGEPLWYVVSPGWAYTSSNLTINSNTAGQLTVDGVASDSLALIIAPGPAFTVAAASGCAAWTQTRPASGTLDWRNYLECENATYPTPDSIFVTSGASASFNDQVLRVTAADLLPAIEAAIAARIEREIVPVLKSVYGTSQWSLSSSNPLFAYAAPFADPGTSAYLGATGTYQGLLPFTSQSASMTWNDAIPPTLTVSNPPQIVGAPTCDLGSGRTRARCRCIGDCTYASLGTPTTFTMTATTQQSVAIGLQQLDSTQVTFQYRPVGGAWTVVGASASGAFNSNGTAAILSGGPLTLPIGVYEFSIQTFSNAVIVDHSLLDPNDPITGWFVRNEWYRLTYYAVAQGHTAAGLPAPACTSSVNCLSVTNVSPAGGQRAILILAGRSINGSARPSSNLGDYWEFGNAQIPPAFERQPVSRASDAALKKPFNDRIIVLDAN